MKKIMSGLMVALVSLGLISNSFGRDTNEIKRYPAARSDSIPGWLAEHFRYMTNGTGRWIADNSKYRSTGEPFDEYGIEWKL